MRRPTNDEYYTEMVRLVASRGTCARRKVGCILVDDRNRVLATGFNGVAPGHPHCIDESHRCLAADAASGFALDMCRASHAEQAALLHCSDVDKVRAAYVTVSPCGDCTKLLLMTGCQRIVFLEEYSHPFAKEWWQEDGREWTHYGA